MSVLLRPLCTCATAAGCAFATGSASAGQKPSAPPAAKINQALPASFCRSSPRFGSTPGTWTSSFTTAADGKRRSRHSILPTIECSQQCADRRPIIEKDLRAAVVVGNGDGRVDPQDAV